MKNKKLPNCQFYYGVRHCFFNLVYNYLYDEHKEQLTDIAEIDANILKVFIKEAINTYYDGYKEKYELSYKKDEKNIFTCLMADQLDVDNSTINKWVKKDYGSKKLKQRIYRTLHKLTKIDINILNGKDYYGIIEYAREYHNTDFETGKKVIAVVNNPKRKAEETKYVNSLFEECDIKEQAIIAKYYKELIVCFEYYDEFFDTFCFLSDEDKERFNDFLGICFTEKEVNLIFSQLNEHKNRESCLIDNITNDSKAMTSDKVDQLKYSIISFSRNELTTIAPNDMQKILINLDICLNSDSNNTKMALLFSALSKEDKKLIDLFITKLLSDEDYIE